MRLWVRRFAAVRIGERDLPNCRTAVYVHFAGLPGNGEDWCTMETKVSDGHSMLDQQEGQVVSATTSFSARLQFLDDERSSLHTDSPVLNFRLKCSSTRWGSLLA